MTNILIKKLIKNYENTGNSRVRENYGKLASIMGIGSNLLLFVIKITVGLLFNSISITADAVNNLSDSGSSLVTLLGFKLSGKPADADHPFGHQRMEYISGLVVSFIILFLGLQLIQSSFDKILHPELPQFSMITVGVLVVAILIKLWQCLFYRKIGKTINSLTLMATAIDSRNDIMATSAVLVATIITYLTGFDLDGYMGVVVAVFIIISGIKLEGTISGFDQYSVLLTDAHGNQQLVYKAKISTIAMHSGRPQVSIQRARKPRVSMAPRPHGAPSRYDDNQGGSSEQ